MICDHLNIKLPRNFKDNLHIGQVSSKVYSFAIASVAIQYHGLLVVLTEDFNIAYQLIKEIKTFIPNNQKELIKILHFPDWETLPFDNFSPHIEIISERLETLYKLPNIEKGILIVPMITLMHRLCPVDYVTKNVLILNKNDKLTLEKLKIDLEQSGYIRVTEVNNFGEFAVRGSIVDFFPLGSNVPYRIDLLDDRLESIRTFDPETQRSIEQKNNIKILPAQEYPFNSRSINDFRLNWFKIFNVDPNLSEIYKNLTKGIKIPGIEYYLPIFFDNTSTLFDYLPNNCLIMRNENCVEAANIFFSQCQSRYKQLSSNKNKLILQVNKLFLNTTEIFSLINKFHQIICFKKKIEKINNGSCNLNIIDLPENIEKLVQNDNFKKIFCTESKGRKEILKKIVAKINPELQLVDLGNLDDFLEKQLNNIILTSKLYNGFVLPESNLAFICEDDLTPNKIKTINKKTEKKINSDLAIKNLMEIKIGDPIVHIEHGIGKYLGLIQLDYTNKSEFLVLEYAEQAKLYVPITNLDLIYRYGGLEVENIVLHKLGTNIWKKEKIKASKQIKDIAVQLLETYALRESKIGFKYSINEHNYQKFIDQFAFIDTPDQAKASLDIKADLTSSKPMDRVVCGDVGFGKTEIAMRAAFMVVENAKQVAVLVPTTLLAQQHYQTFLDRFVDFPVNIELLSRFVDLKQKKNILNKLSTGTCDIIIGTHKLLQKDLKFKSLGLLIIDEEHKFGVEQKENFKKLRNEIDILSLTATPIPRTLNMAMSGIRDLSIIATPPSHRLSVKTFVREFNIEIIKEAIMRELQRGGQVYYLHNKIDNIQQIANNLKKLLPHAIIKIAHGQLEKKELEHIMIDFYHRKFNLLICTTIIENGIDIPNANTIIIDRADCFGLSQLHQLRGRVGRSHHQAYAFCFTPEKSILTEDALKRLQALENSDTLGMGFTLATHDLEIRGSGELLGMKQSGHINTIGFGLYMELLEQAVNYLKQNKQNTNNIECYDLENNITNAHVEIDLKISAFIPNSYIPDVHTRLILYKKIAQSKTNNEIMNLNADFYDRFGQLPLEVKNLFDITKIKIVCQKIGIKKIIKTKDGFDIEFLENTKINPTQLVNLLQNDPKTFKLKNNKLFCIANNDFTEPEKILYVNKILNDLR